MSKPLTEEQKKEILGYAWDTDEQDTMRAALARLDFLERKVQAADRLQGAVVDGTMHDVVNAAVAYDEVTE